MSCHAIGALLELTELKGDKKVSCFRLNRYPPVSLFDWKCYLDKMSDLYDLIIWASTGTEPVLLCMTAAVNAFPYLLHICFMF